MTAAAPPERTRQCSGSRSGERAVGPALDGAPKLLVFVAQLSGDVVKNTAALGSLFALIVV